MADEGEPQGTPTPPEPPTQAVPPAPPPFPPPAPPVGAAGEPPIVPLRRRWSPLAVVAAVVGVLGVTGGVVFAATQIVGDDGSPEEAAERLFEAIADEDVLGVLEALPSGERDAVRDPLVDLSDELVRLEVLADDLDLRSISGLDVEFDGLAFSSRELGDGLAEVTIDEGTARSRVDPAEIPLGDFVTDLAGPALREADVLSEEQDVEEDVFLIAVQDGGRWRISLWYTLAEQARREAGLPRPDLDDRLEPAGAESPEAAVEELLRAAADFDLRRVLELLPPDEARALHDYAPLFLDDAELALGDARRGVDVEITELEVEAQVDGDRALVQVREFGFRADVPSEDVFVEYADGCLSLDIEGTLQEVCPGRSPEDVLGSLFGSAFGGIPAFFDEIEPPPLDLERPELGFVVVREGGEWYVSPTRTLVENVTAFLRPFERADLDTIVEYVQELFLSFEEFGEEFEESEVLTGEVRSEEFAP